MGYISFRTFCINFLRTTLVMGSDISMLEAHPVVAEGT